jgi:hypothetical protein
MLLEYFAVLIFVSLIAADFIPELTRELNRKAEGYRTQHCQSNLKMIGIALTEYVQDYDEQTPVIGKNGTGWASAIYPYIKSTDSFKCPDDPLTETDDGYPESYAMNSNLTQKSGPMAKYRKQENVTDIGATVIAFETEGAVMDMTASDEYRHSGGSGYHSPVGNGLAPVDGTANLTSGGLPVKYATGDIGGRGQSSDTCPATPRHDPNSLYLAADGHVKRLPPDRVSSGTVPTSNSAQTGNAKSGTAAASNRLGNRFTLTFSAR